MSAIYLLTVSIDL